MTRAVKILWRTTFIGIGVFIILIIAINYGLFGPMPSVLDLQNPSASLASEIYADDGTLMGKYYLEDRSSADLKDISKNVIDALVSTEDERFYDHDGIDGKSLLRSVKGVITFNPDGGGSTITQQLALNLFGEKRATNKIARIKQKLKEWIIAVKLEKNFTKDEIITYYLNTVPFGDNVYGIRNASRTFFQKDPNQLTVDEAAVLIGMLKGNTEFNPRRNPKAALDRRNTVLDQMVRNDKLNKDEAERLKQTPIKLNYKKMDQSNGIAPYFRENVLKDEVKKLLKDKVKPNGKPYDIYRDGLRIYTTINPKIQLYGEDAVSKNVANQQRTQDAVNSYRADAIWKKFANRLEDYIKQSDRWQNQNEDGITDEQNRRTFDMRVPMKVFAWNSKLEKDTVMTPLDSIKYHRQLLQSGFMAMDPLTGDIKAWVGGIHYKLFKFDHVNLNAKRQVGSTIKPMLYCQAIEEAGFTPETPCINAAQYFPGFGLVPAKGGGSGAAEPMWHALALSHNGVAAYLMKQIGPKRFVDFLNNCNIQTKVSPYPSIALGSCDLSLFEMIWMYSMFPGRGFNTKPKFITRIEDHNGNVLVQVEPQHKEVISEVTAYTMAKMMGGCVKFGTGRGMTAYNIKAEMGAKTGTTNDNSDDWFICFTPQLMCGTWIGLDDRFIKTTGDGGHVAMPTCGIFMRSIYNDKGLGFDPEAKFIKPAVDKNDVISDWIEGKAYSSPDAQGWDMGNGEIVDYMDYESTNDSSLIKAESKQDFDNNNTSYPDTGKNKFPNKNTPKAVMPTGGNKVGKPENKSSLGY